MIPPSTFKSLQFTASVRFPPAEYLYLLPVDRLKTGGPDFLLSIKVALQNDMGLSEKVSCVFLKRLHYSFRYVAEQEIDIWGHGGDNSIKTSACGVAAVERRTHAG